MAFASGCSYVAIGVTASGLFSQSSAVRSHAPAVRRAKSTPNLSHSSGSIKSSLPNKASNTEADFSHQETVHLLGNNAQSRNYPTVEDSQDQVTDMKPGILHAFAVALALSVHSVFEGLAFGLQDSIDDVCEHLISATCVVCMYCTFMCAYIFIYVYVLCVLLYVHM